MDNELDPKRASEEAPEAETNEDAIMGRADDEDEFDDAEDADEDDVDADEAEE
jgi:hypothetical protein